MLDVLSVTAWMEAVVGKTLLTPRNSLNAFFRPPSQLNVRTVGSQQKLTAHFIFNSIHKLNLAFNCDGDLKKAFNECLGLSNVFPTTA